MTGSVIAIGAGIALICALGAGIGIGIATGRASEAVARQVEDGWSDSYNSYPWCCSFRSNSYLRTCSLYYDYFLG